MPNQSHCNNPDEEHTVHNQCRISTVYHMYVHWKKRQTEKEDEGKNRSESTNPVLLMQQATSICLSVSMETTWKRNTSSATK